MILFMSITQALSYKCAYYDHIMCKPQMIAGVYTIEYNILEILLTLP